VRTSRAASFTAFCSDGLGEEDDARLDGPIRQQKEDRRNHGEFERRRALVGVAAAPPEELLQTRRHRSSVARISKAEASSEAEAVPDQ
jgi:hypothetical protein